MIPLRPNQDRKRMAMIAIYFAMAVDAFNILSVSINYYSLAGGTIPDIMGYVSYYFDLISGVGQLGITLIVGIIFIMWFRRAYWNLHQLVKHLNHSEGWAAGAWFVPIMSLFRPYQIMQELWLKTPRYLKKHNVEPAKIAGDVPLGWWWAAFISSAIISNISGRLYLRSDDLGLYEGAIITDYVSTGLSLIAGFLILKIIDGYHELEHQLQQVDHSILATETQKPGSFVSFRS